MNASPNLTDPYDPMAGTLAGSYARAGTFQGEPFPPLGEPEHGTSTVPDVPGNVPALSVLLTLPYPISANRYWASRTVTPRGKPAFTSTYVTPEAKAYKAQVQKLALVAGVRKPIAGRVRVEFTLYPNRPQDWQKRMRKDGAAWDDTVQCLDLDNAQKVVLDSLKDVVFQDDAWVREISARRAEPDEFGARLVAVVTPLAVEQPQTDLFGAVAQERKA
jgi:Holliday junction resolvase RusA-like endonuclease